MITRSLYRRQILFACLLYREADYWAHAWGFDPGEYKVIRRPEDVIGRRVDSPVYVCGSNPLPEELFDCLILSGADTFVDAHDLDTNFEPRSALDLLPETYR